MNYDEYKELIMDLIKDPDTALTKVETILESLQKDSETFASIKEANEQMEQRIRTLQDTNMQLFLRASGEVKEEPEEPKEPTTEELFDNLVKENEENE